MKSRAPTPIVSCGRQQERGGHVCGKGQRCVEKASARRCAAWCIRAIVTSPRPRGNAHPAAERSGDLWAGGQRGCNGCCWRVRGRGGARRCGKAWGPPTLAANSELNMPARKKLDVKICISALSYTLQGQDVGVGCSNKPRETGGHKLGRQGSGCPTNRGWCCWPQRPSFCRRHPGRTARKRDGRRQRERSLVNKDNGVGGATGAESQVASHCPAHRRRRPLTFLSNASNASTPPMQPLSYLQQRGGAGQGGGEHWRFQQRRLAAACTAEGTTACWGAQAAQTTIDWRWAVGSDTGSGCHAKCRAGDKELLQSGRPWRRGKLSRGAHPKSRPPEAATAATMITNQVRWP
jgi:hypothetical protein